MSTTCVNRTRTRIPAVLVCRDVRRALRYARRWRRTRLAPRAMSLVFVTSAESRRLKRTWLGQDRPANVLSFNYGAEGEIVLAPAVIRRQARREGEPYLHLLRRMAIHGLLHLLGYHHEGSSLHARRFEARERRLARVLHLAPAVVRAA